MTALYIGIDISKTSLSVSLISPELLKKHKKYELCPSFTFEQSRTGFDRLMTAIIAYAPVAECAVLVENTGHYGHALEQYLQESGIAVYRVHVQQRPKGSKSDKRDAQALAVHLYNQVGLGVLVSEKSQIAHRLTPPSDSARLLTGLIQRRYELIEERTQRKNKLIAIVDELFPELTQIYKNTNTESALALREKYPLPSDILAATLDDLAATRKHHLPGRAELARLQELARSTIGTKDVSQRASLSMEQKQLIKESRMLDEHIAELEEAIGKVIAESREGQILTSIPGIGPIQAATLIAGIGSIANFESIAKLRAYTGWSPLQTQTGTSIDSMSLNKGGNRKIKTMLYLIAIQSLSHDTPWKALYDRLVPMKCSYDERLGRYRGRMKVIGRVIGQMLSVVYTLLRRDYDVLASTAPGVEPAAPELYDAAKHRMNKKIRPVLALV